MRNFQAGAPAKSQKRNAIKNEKKPGGLKFKMRLIDCSHWNIRAMMVENCAKPDGSIKTISRRRTRFLCFFKRVRASLSEGALVRRSVRRATHHNNSTKCGANSQKTCIHNKSVPLARWFYGRHLKGSLERILCLNSITSRLKKILKTKSRASEFWAVRVWPVVVFPPKVRAAGHNGCDFSNIEY